MRRRASAIATFSLPWKYRFAISDDMVILTLGSQSTSSDHCQCRLPSSPSVAARMLTTRSMSGNSNRCGTSASRSFGPMSASSLIVVKIQSITDRNSFGDANSAPMTQEPELRVLDDFERSPLIVLDAFERSPLIVADAFVPDRLVAARWVADRFVAADFVDAAFVAV